MIDRLERAGYVRRVPDPGDRRKVRVEAVPDAAWQAFRRFDGLMASLAEFTAGYSDEQVALLGEMLAGFRARLAAFTGELRSQQP